MTRHHTPPARPAATMPLFGNDDACLMPVYSVPRDEQVAGLLMRSMESHVASARRQMSLRRREPGKPVEPLNGRDAVGNLKRAASLLLVLADLEREAEIAALLPEPEDGVL